jgi:hypothetical protein
VARPRSRLDFSRWLRRNDAVQPADLILVMAGRMERKRYGLDLYRAGLAPRLVLSVGRFEVSKMTAQDLESIDELRSLRDRTAPADRHFFVTFDAGGVRIETSTLFRWSTYGEVIAFRKVLEDYKPRQVMVVSTDIHLSRVALTFARVFREMPMEFLFCAVPVDDSSPSNRRDSVLEAIKLAGYRIGLSAPRWLSRRLMAFTGWGRK